MSTPADKLTALGFSAQQAELLVATFATSGAPIAAAPVFSPSGGVYAVPQTVAITSSTPNSEILFTEDGSTPTFPPTGTTQTYVNAIAVSASTTIQAIVVASGYQNSAVQSISYVINNAGNQATTPIVQPPAGTYTTAQTASLSCVTAGATIYFTLDGTTPTNQSTIYAAPFSIVASGVLKALAIAPGYTPSAVLIAPFVIAGPTTLPVTFSIPGGTYTSTQSVTLACASPSPSIYYTLDGSTPTTSSTLYSGAISVSASETITAIATSAGLANSAPTNAVYVITTQAAAPTFSPVAGTYAGNQVVTLGLPTNGVGYYTTDGTTPSVVGGVPQGTTQLYTSAGIPIPPGSSTVAAPTFSPAAGTYSGAQSVSILSPAGSTVYFTLDGSTPTTGSAVYSAAIAVGASETIKAIAVAGGIVSSVASAAYVIGSGGGTGTTPVFNFPNFSSMTGLVNNRGSSVQNGAKFSLIPAGSGHVAGAVWWGTLVDVSGGLTLDWSDQFTNMSTIPTICGGTLCIQNTQATGNPYGHGLSYNGDANACGYGEYNPAFYPANNDPTNSVAIKFDANTPSVWSFKEGGSPSSTGYYENGGPYNGLLPMNDLQPDGINFYAGNILKHHVVYDGVGTIVQTITDTITGAQSRMEWPSNIQNALSGNFGYIGLTGGSAGSTPEGLDVLSFSCSKGFLTRNSQPTFSPAAGQYSGSQTVTISGPSGSTIYYTTNGRLPTTASMQYTGPITVAANAVIKAIAVQSGYTDSLTASAVYKIGTAYSINCPSGFSANNGVIPCGHAQLVGSAIQLIKADSDMTNWGGGGGAAWYGAPIPVNTFSTTFTVQFSSPGSAGYGAGGGFVIQNTPAAKGTASTAKSWPSGLYALGGAQNGFGQGGVIGGSGGGSIGFQNDVILAWDLENTPNSVGLYTNGAACTGSQRATGLTLAGGNPIKFALTYDGTTLSLTMTDTVTNATFSTTWPINIPAIVGGNTAYVGYTASSYYGYACTQSLINWVM